MYIRRKTPISMNLSTKHRLVHPSKSMGSSNSHYSSHRKFIYIVLHDKLRSVIQRWLIASGDLDAGSLWKSLERDGIGSY